MIKAQSNIRPEAVEKCSRGYRINFNIEEKLANDPENGSEIQFEYEQVFVKISATREEIIFAIIRNAYPIDAELATVNNYLADLENQTTQEEYAAYQERRAFAKELADQTLNILI